MAPADRAMSIGSISTTGAGSLSPGTQPVTDNPSALSLSEAPPRITRWDFDPNRILIAA